MEIMDKQEHFPEQEVQRTHTATCLIQPPPMRTLTKSRQITLNKHLNRKVNCVNKISG